jgi:hypothetical protein
MRLREPEWGQVTYLPKTDSENKLVIGRTLTKQYHG